ncbi:MAG: nucleotidyltransferase domain-containing protein, partial [bacterium]
MDALTALKSFFAREGDVSAAYLYGRYATDRTWPDSDLEVALVFPPARTEDEISEYMERLSSANPLGDVPGILMPFALNTHILPVIYEVLTGATLIVAN